jgi:hypothetical protein
MSKTSWIEFLVICFIAMALVGCGTANQTLKMDDSFKCPPEAKIEVGKVTNETGKVFEEIDIVTAFTKAITQKLEEQNLLFKDLPSEKLVLDTKIVEYEPGNAFKRWLLPGYGSTILAVKCDLKLHPDQKSIGSLEARRTVDAGGGYTIGAWNTIVGQVADDVIKKLKEEALNKK